MRPHQIKYFNEGRESVIADLKNCIPIDSAALVVLLNDFKSASGEMTENVAHRDGNFELIGTTSETFQTADALGHDLAGRITALAEFCNAALRAGTRLIRG